MATVAIHMLDDNQDDKVVGHFLFNDGKLSIAKGSDPLLEHLLEESILIGREEFTARDNPEQWFNNLYRLYKTAYLRATKPEEESQGGTNPKLKRLPPSGIRSMYGYKGLAYHVKEQRKDAAGHTYCVEEGRGRVPCNSNEQEGQQQGQGQQGGGTQYGANGEIMTQQAPPVENAPHDHTGGKEEPTEKQGRSYAPPPEGEAVTEAPCCLYDPDPHAVDEATGVSKAARVGVPAMQAPPPPKEIPRLPNLTEREREAETAFADMYLADPDGVCDSYRQQLKAGKIGDAPNIFNTDDVKLLSPHYNPQGGDENAVKDARSTFNTCVHQTANAIAKRAFLAHLDDVVAGLPDDKKVVLVTSGGVAAGKGYALKNAPGTSDLAGQAAAIWDAAGEQNAIENPWVLEECQKRGIRAVFAFVHADPVNTWENPQRGVVERAGKIGRMVDARVFSDSYALGAKNFDAFRSKNQSNPNARFFIINNAAQGGPKVEEDMPKEALKVDAEDLYNQAVTVMEERKGNLKPAVYRGGTMGTRVWGLPQEGGSQEKKKEKRLRPSGLKRLYGYSAKGEEMSEQNQASNEPAEPAEPADPNKHGQLDHLAHNWAQQMTKNLVNNDKNRDQVDEEDFKRSQQAEPLGGDDTSSLGGSSKGPKTPKVNPKMGQKK